MAKHVTDKDLDNIVGKLEDIKYLETLPNATLVSIINELTKRVMTLEGNNPDSIQLLESGILIPFDGIDI